MTPPAATISSSRVTGTSAARMNFAITPAVFSILSFRIRNVN